MLVFIMFIVALLLAIGLLFLKEKVFDWDSIPYNISSILGIFLCIATGLGIFICGTLAIVSNFPTTKQQVKNDLEQKIEEIQSDYDYIQLITDDRAKSVAVVEYNKQVKEFKTLVLSEQYLLDNIWVNWYTCSEYGNYDANVVVYIK